MLGAFCAQDLILFVAFFDLMLIPFYFLVGAWGGARPGAGDDQAGDLHRGRLVPDAGRGGRHRRDRRRPAGRPPELHVHGPRARAPVALHAGLGVPVLRRRLPGQDAAGPVPRLAARRLQGDADPGPRGVLRGPVQGRGLRVPADRAAAVPVRLAALPAGDAAGRAGLDRVGHLTGLHRQGCAPRGRLLERGPAGLHHAGDLLPAPRRRPGRPSPDGQPRPGHRRRLLPRGRGRRPLRRQREGLDDMGGVRRSARPRCWPPCSWIVHASPPWRCPARPTSSGSS